MINKISLFLDQNNCKNNFNPVCNKTRMTTFIKTKFKISDLESPSNFQVKEKIIIQIGPETTKLDFCGPDSNLGKVQYGIWNPHQNSKSKKKKIIQIGPESTKLDCCCQDSHLGKVR